MFVGNKFIQKEDFIPSWAREKTKNPERLHERVFSFYFVFFNILKQFLYIWTAGRLNKIKEFFPSPDLLHHRGLIGIHFDFLRLGTVIGTSGRFHQFRFLPKNRLCEAKDVLSIIRKHKWERVTGTYWQILQQVSRPVLEMRTMTVLLVQDSDYQRTCSQLE